MIDRTIDRMIGRTIARTHDSTWTWPSYTVNNVFQHWTATSSTGFNYTQLLDWSFFQPNRECSHTFCISIWHTLQTGSTWSTRTRSPGNRDLIISIHTAIHHTHCDSHIILINRSLLTMKMFYYASFTFPSSPQHFKGIFWLQYKLSSIWVWETYKWGQFVNINIFKVSIVMPQWF